MARDLYHPSPEQIGLSAIYDALSDPVRRGIVLRLAEEGELNCSSFSELGSKTNLSYHLARLRESGLTRARIDGTLRFIQLRVDDLQARFPGLLEAVVASLLEERQASEAESVARAKSSRRA